MLHLTYLTLPLQCSVAIYALLCVSHLALQRMARLSHRVYIPLRVGESVSVLVKMKRWARRSKERLRSARGDDDEEAPRRLSVAYKDVSQSYPTTMMP